VVLTRRTRTGRRTRATQPAQQTTFFTSSTAASASHPAPSSSCVQLNRALEVCAAMPSWWWSRTNKRKNEPSNHRPPPPHPVNTPTTSTTTPPPSRSPGLHRLPGDREERGRAASTRRRRGGARFAPPRDAAAGRRAPWLCRSKASRSRGPSRGQLRLGSFLRADTAPCRGLRVGVGRELAGVRRRGGGRPQVHCYDQLYFFR
jgi:hypothetical protein